MTKATHNGTCQLCGRLQAVKANGRIAKHGYQVKWNQFLSTCEGSDAMPLEKSKVLVGEHIEYLQGRSAALDAEAAGPIEKVFCPTISTTHGAHKIQRVYNEQEYRLAISQSLRFNSFSWAQAQVSERRRLQVVSLEMMTHAYFMENLIESRHGKPLIPRAVAE